MNASKQAKAAALAAAKAHLGIETLTERKSGSLDFHEVAVWSLEAALVAAYEAGRKAARS